ncbi:MAG TPA: hypothetical protein VMF69_12875 [Gemmataceae bacterium]|nr:hypothetical protein [Gemmataceae bacterium]
MQRTPLRCGFVLAVLAVLGCGHDEPLTPVHGRVFFHGQPLPGGTIVFTPDAERGGRGPLAYGEIAADGHYSLRSGDRPGAVAGWHRITIAPAARAVELPRRYSDPEQSGLLREVHPGKSGEQDFYLE